MQEYIIKAATAWFLGFFPLFEIYFAVPAAIAMGLDYPSAVFWPVLGNFLAVPVVLGFYDQLRRFDRVEQWFERRKQSRFAPMLDRYGAVIVLAGTPWTGVWAMAAIAGASGMSNLKLLITSGVSIVVYGIAIAAIVGLGIAAWG